MTDFPGALSYTIFFSNALAAIRDTLPMISCSPHHFRAMSRLYPNLDNDVIVFFNCVCPADFWNQENWFA